MLSSRVVASAGGSWTRCAQSANVWRKRWSCVISSSAVTVLRETRSCGCPPTWPCFCPPFCCAEQAWVGLAWLQPSCQEAFGLQVPEGFCCLLVHGLLFLIQLQSRRGICGKCVELFLGEVVLRLANWSLTLRDFFSAWPMAHAWVASLWMRSTAAAGSSC